VISLLFTAWSDGLTSCLQILLVGEGSRNAQNEVSKPVAIFQSVATVGLDSPRSI